MSVNPVMAAPTTESMITCPECGTVKVEQMPIYACQFYYDCSGCGALLRPKAGDCCVFCSYGSVRCPSKQDATSGDALGCEGCYVQSDGDSDG